MILNKDGKQILDNVSLSIDPRELMIGERAEIKTSFMLPDGGDVIVDYVMEFMRANGRYSNKVFKCKILSAEPHEKIEIKKMHTFKKDATTFTHYPGLQKLHLQINGNIVASTSYVLS